MEFRCRCFVAPIIVGCILIGVLTCVYAYEESTIDGSSIAESNGNNFESERPAVFPNTPADSEIDAFLPCACSSTSTENLVLVSTLDGQLIALNSDFYATTEITPENANFVWRFDAAMGPLLSSTLDDLPVNLQDENARIIPSLDGTLYLYKNAYVQAIPVNTDALLSSSAKLGSDVIAGGKDLRTFGINRKTGEKFYECGIEGCNYLKSDDHSDKLIVRRLTQTVRAVDGKSGIEKWNVTTGNFDISLSSTLENSDRNANCFCNTFFCKTSDNDNACGNRAAAANDYLDLKVSPAEGKIYAFDKRRPNSRLWIYNFNVPIAQLWTLSGERLEELSLLDARNILNLGYAVDSQSSFKHADSLETVFYVGTYDNEKYVMTSKEEKLLHIQSQQHNPLVPKDHGRLYLAAASDQLNGKSCSPEDVNAVILHNQFKQNSGWYLMKHKTPESLKRLEAWTAWRPQLRIPRRYSLAEHVAVCFSLWNWWKEISGILVLFALGAHIVIYGGFRLRQSKNDLALNVKPAESAANAEVAEAEAEADGLVLQAQASSAESEISQNSNPSSEFESRYLQEFEPLRCLGKGGFGIVYEARNKLDDVTYAVKRIAVADTETAKHRVMREVKALAKLDHPGIVRYYHSWLENPPDGWQEAKDVEILLKCGFHDESGSTFPKVVGNSADLTTTRNDDSSLAIELDRKIFGSLVEIKSGASFAEDESASRSKATGFSSENSNSSGAELSNDWTRFDGNSTASGSSESELSRSRSDGRSAGAGPNRRLLDSRSAESVEVVFQHSADKSGSEKFAAPSKRDDRRKISDDLREIADMKETPSLKKAPIYLYIQMQLCSLSTLRHWLAANQQRDRVEMLDWFLQIVAAVEYVHSSGLVHRDLKPSNIFFSLTGQIKVGDFGLAKAALADAKSRKFPAVDVSQHTDNVGTALYMSPEQVSGKPYTEKVDIFSLGLIFVEMLCPCSTDMERVNTLTMAKQLRFPRYLSNEDTELARRMLAPVAEDRASCCEICDSTIFDVVDSAVNASAALLRRSRTKSRSFAPSASVQSANSVSASASSSAS